MYQSFSFKYNTWKLSVVLLYSDFISFSMWLCLFKSQKMIAISYEQMERFCFESIYENNFQMKIN